MPKAKRVCSIPGCPRVQAESKCSEHRREAERARGTTTERGYGAEHAALRVAWQRRLDSGERVFCTSPTCLHPGVPISPTNWQLGHDDMRRHRGPEHPDCNLVAAGRSSHR